MTDPRSTQPVENVVGGGLLALLALPLGVVIVVLISSIGFAAAIVGFVVAFAALWLYRRGSGGVISRTGAWVVTGIVVITLLVGVWAVEVVAAAGGLGQLGLIWNPAFWPAFAKVLPHNLGVDGLFIVLIFVFGALGSFRLLRRAFATARVAPTPTMGVAPTGGDGLIAPTTYRNDVDAPPTGSADDKTPPPAAGA